MAAIAIVATLVVGFTFVLTQSRGGYIGLALTALLLGGWLLPRGRRVYWAVLGVLLLALGVALAYYGPETVLRVALGGAASDSAVFALDNFDGRVVLWSHTLYAIEDFAFTGMGMNTYRYIMPVLYPLPFATPVESIPHAHNEFLQAAVDLGVPGLLAFASLYAGAAVQLVRRWRGATGAAGAAGRWLVLGLAGGLLAHLLYGLTDAVALGAKPGVLFWVLLGLIVSSGAVGEGVKG
jgi:putative inorganic carbon (HCO3(-)) transporter